MLIEALCNYYDILEKAGKTLPEGYKKKWIRFIISLKEDGEIDGIIRLEKPKEMLFPRGAETTSIKACVADHRPLYIFGMNMDGSELTTEDKTDKAKKSHEAFVKDNLRFIEKLDSPVINAFRNFLKTWDPAKQIKSQDLLNLGNDYQKSGYAFCLSGHPDQLLQDDLLIKQKWEQINCSKDEIYAQCAIYGQKAPIPYVHDSILGLKGGLASGNKLVCFKNQAECSYGNTQSANSNISRTAMKKYTEALNYLLSGYNHKTELGDMTIVFWAMEPSGKEEDLFTHMLMGRKNKTDANDTDRFLKEIMDDIRQGTISKDRIGSLDGIDPDMDFYIVGLKPNKSRISVKFFNRGKYADILYNIAQFQEDTYVGNKYPLSVFDIMKNLFPEKGYAKESSNLMSKLMESVINNRPYPEKIFTETIQRLHAIRKLRANDDDINIIDAGVLKAYLNRNYKEEIKMDLDKNDTDSAYLCGRLFAVLEKVQLDASKGKLNTTIADSFMQSASTMPATIFPLILNLSKYHLKKAQYSIRYEKIIEEIMGKMKDGFPETVDLKGQGNFYIGYYMQKDDLYKKKESTNTNPETKNTDEKSVEK